MCVCMCAYVCVCLYYAYMYVYMCVRMYVCMYKCMYVCLCVCIMCIRYLSMYLSVRPSVRPGIHHHLSAGSLNLFSFSTYHVFQGLAIPAEKLFSVAVTVIDALFVYQSPWPRSQCVKALTRSLSQSGAYRKENSTSFVTITHTHYERHCTWILVTHRTDYRK